MQRSVPVQKLLLHSLELSRHLLERTTSVKLEAEVPGDTGSMVKTHYGMEQAVVVPAPVVSSTILHGFVSSCHNQPLRILSLGSVVMLGLIMRILLLSK